MLKKELTIENRSGLHARPAAVFVEVADRFQADIELGFDGIIVNAKSIIGVLSLGIGQGDLITLLIEGEDEQEAMATMVQLIEDKFGETK
ncbi:MAG: HPr family phosphocarrier protein [Halanaerobiales bacterium]|nr:HPr family phosphocarrier protein [Halanaerobiales bacterium]